MRTWGIFVGAAVLVLPALATASPVLTTGAASLDAGLDTVTDDRSDLTVGASSHGLVYIPQSSSLLTYTADASLRGGSDGAGLSFHEEAKLRPWQFYLFQPGTGARLALDVAPSLSDRPDRWRRRYSSAGFDADIIFLHYYGAHVGVQLVNAKNGFDVEVQHDGAHAARRPIQTADWSVLAVTERDRGEEIGRLDVMAVTARAVGGTRSGVVITTWFPRLALPVGPLRLEAAYGSAETGSTSVEVDDKTVSQIDTHGLPHLRDVPAWYARVGWNTRSWHAKAGVERGLFVSAEAQLVIDERATATAGTRFKGVDLETTGFLARSDVWSSETSVHRHVTGGGEVTASFEVHPTWQLVNRAAVARTFYASLDGALAPQVDTAVALDIGLHHEIANWVPR